MFRAAHGWRLAEPSPQEGDHAERRQVTFIKDDRIAERDGTAVVRARIDEVEDSLRPLAIALIPGPERVSIDSNNSGHIQLPATSYQLPASSFQLSAFSFQLSAFSL